MLKTFANCADSQRMWPLILKWAHSAPPSPVQKQAMAAWMLNDTYPKVHPLTVETIGKTLDAYADLLQQFVQRIEKTSLSLPLPGTWADWLRPLWILWIPLAQHISQQQKQLNQPFIQGILGGQGTGKTTLTKILLLLLDCLGHRSVGLSIDDLYLSYAERCELKRVDPRFVWRGPPGTHDIDLGLKTLTALKTAAGGTIDIPRFDKSLHGGQGDRRSPVWSAAPSIVLFEGWFVGTQPFASKVLDDPTFAFPAPIITAADRQFAKDCNQRLRDYEPLWSLLDSLIVLVPEDYRYSRQWRQQAEQAMIAQGKNGLSPDQIAAFVNYFWQALHPELFIEPLTASKTTSLVVCLDREHQISRLYSP